MKKFLAILLSAVLMLSLTMPAMAANEGTAQNGPFTVTINNATGHSYKIYQIFTGDLATNNGEEVLSNLKYGTDYVPTGKNVGDDAEVPADPTTIKPTGAGKNMTTTGDVATITVEKAGYYMIEDVTQSVPAGEEKSKVMFQVVGNTTITSKHTGTTIVKKVQDINDTTGEYTLAANQDTWIDSADYDIKDKVPFKSTSHFEGMANYKTYKVVITDIMAKGLTYNKDMTITVNGEACTTGYTIEVTENYSSNDEYNGGTVITVTFENIKGVNGTENVADVVLTYSATLNDKANFGAAGNPNKIKATTKPDGEGEKDTPWDVNIVFTYKVSVDKYTTINGTETALTGAGFTLYKEVANAATVGAQTGADIKAALRATNASIKAEALKDDAYYVIAAQVKTDAAGDTFSFEGIDDGTYVLVETTIPAGYNAWDAEAFTVAATHDVVADEPKLTELNGGDLCTGAVNTGILSTKIENNAGVELPETGGIGTTIFYVVGGVMAAAAVILLITKKRMSAEG